ncbi:hypothetical protein D8676_11610 [Mesorhizobium sp. YM1C-6-2]|nr:hypothetical protein D8676_11610 [Mesorhizobium sp. YM1C-6-2]
MKHEASAVAVFASGCRVREGGVPIIVLGQNTWVCTGHAVISAAGMLLLRLTLRVGLRIASIPISQVGFIVFAAFMSRFGQAYAQRRLLVFGSLLGKVVAGIWTLAWLKFARAVFISWLLDHG